MTPNRARDYYSRNAFTLIELLIVVAIIAILAAIALPNFLEAQTRSKISRVRADMRTVATGLESYAVDYNRYPPMYIFQTGDFTTTYYFFVPNHLTTPIAYLSSSASMFDIFKPVRQLHDSSQLDPEIVDRFNYANPSSIEGEPNLAFNAYPPFPRAEYTGGWELWSYGPDRASGPFYLLPNDIRVYIQYDATNGTVSDGDIKRTRFDTLGVMKGAQ